MIRKVTEEFKHEFNRLATHPLQSWQWGDFRQKTGIKIIRLGRFREKSLVEIAQMSLHEIPKTGYMIGYIPKGIIPSMEMTQALYNFGKINNCIFIKFEPNIELISNPDPFNIFSGKFLFVKSPHPLFTKYSFQLDLNFSDDDLLKKFHPKTRYNIKVAQKHKVSIKEDNSRYAFERYLDLTTQTTKRQGFFAHDDNYHRLMWNEMRQAGIAHLFSANYSHEGSNIILVTWILFIFNGVLYYPYGASSQEYKNTMASNLMMWEAIRFGKKIGAKTFDMWGALGPNPDTNDPWFGFHRFKQGYGANLVEFVDSHDLIIKSIQYQIYNNLYTLRNVFLKLKAKM